MTTVERARHAAQEFVDREAGFAQVVTLDRAGIPVGRTMSAFLQPDFSVLMVQRASHARLAQMRRHPVCLVTWVGSPAAGAQNATPHVFDLGLLPPRAVFVRGHVEELDAPTTEEVYRRELLAQRAAGHDRAPVRDAATVASELTGVRVDPVRVRLEGFGEGPQAFEWNVEEDR